MICHAIVVAGIEVPCDSPVFLAFLAVHVPFGLACVVTGIVAMLSKKSRGLHPTFGTIYYWCLAVVFASATALAAMRWAENYHLFILGLLSVAAASFGPHGSSAMLARLGHAAYQRHGPVVHPAADSVLRGQWQEPAALEGTSLDCVLAVAWRGRSAAYRSGALATPSGRATEKATVSALNAAARKGSFLPRGGRRGAATPPRSSGGARRRVHGPG